jgi:hypothetical protein
MGAPAILFIRRGAGDKRRPLATLKFRPISQELCVLLNFELLL